MSNKPLKKTLLSLPNKKLKKSMHDDEFILSFGLPARITCPCAGECAKWCYGGHGNYLYREPIEKRARNLEIAASPEFVELMNAELKTWSYVKKLLVRIHDTGDFFSPRYLEDWITIARMNPDVTFYAYTKCVKMVKEHELPDNFIVGFSYGGTQDDLIEPGDRQIKVFKKEVPEGWVNGSDDDHVMMNNLKTGLIYH